jgi:hypothetical protein
MNETTRRENDEAIMFRDEANTGMRGVSRLMSEKARVAGETVRSHPYFAAGILAGIGIAVFGIAFAVRANRRRGLLDQLLRLF